MTSDQRATGVVPLQRNFAYIRLLGAQSLSTVSREVGALVWPLFILALTNSPAQAGFIAALEAVPYLIFGLPAGAIVDRISRKQVMLVCNLVRAAALVSLPLAFWLWGTSLIQIYVVALITGVAFVFYNIAELACLPQLVAKGQLQSAVSVNVIGEWVSELMAPALAGAVVGLGATAIRGGMMGFVLQGALLAVSVLFVAGIANPLRIDTGAKPARNLWVEMRQGMAWLVRHRTIRALAALAMALNLIFSPIQLALIVLAKTQYHASAPQIGVLFAIAGVVGLLATFAAPWVRKKLNVGTIIVGGIWIWAIGMVLVAMSNSLVTLGAAWSLMPFVSGVSEVTTTSYRLELIPDEMQGRVNSVFRFMAWGLRPAMLAVGGVAISTLGARPTLWLLAAAMILTALAVAASELRSVR